MIKFSILIIISYILGSIPTSYLLGKKLRGIDLRQYGSKNVGFTNAFRCLGWKIGVVALAGDILKGFLPALIFPKFLIFDSGWLGVSANSGLVFGAAAIIGHIWTIFLRFKGGKGVATSLGVFLALTPLPLLITLTICALLILITKFVSLGSITGSIMLPVLIYFMEPQKPSLFVVSILIGLFILIRHRENLVRLLKGKELPLRQIEIKKD